MKHNFNKVIRQLAEVTEDHDQLKEKTISTTYAISYITSRLTMGKAIIQEAHRQWKDGLLSPQLMDYFNLSLPCGSMCPLGMATPQKCSLDVDKTRMFMQFSLPIINETLVLVEADPFELMVRKENKTCTVRYKGPTNAVLSRKSNCIYGLNLRKPASHDMILSPNDVCKGNLENTRDTHYFHVDECRRAHHNDQDDFLQIKPHHGTYHIYCPEGTISIGGTSRKCPDHVFTLPVQANFKINDVEYVGSQVHISHQERIDSMWTARTNWLLRPTVNWSTLLISDEDLKPVQPEKTVEVNDYHILSWFLSGVAIFLFFVFALFGTLYVRKNNKIPTVIARPLEMEKVRNQDEVDAGLT